MKKAKTFLINSSILIFTSIITKIMCSLFDIYIANKIGSETLGIFSLISSIYLVGITFCSSGINFATTKIISEELEKDANVNTKQILKISSLYSLITGTFSAIILISFAKYISSNILNHMIPPYIISILATSLPFISLSLSLSSYFLAKRNVLSSSINQIVTAITRIVVIFITLNVFTKDISSSILSLVLGTTISEVISLIMHYLIFLLERKNIHQSHAKPKNISKRILSIAVPIAITSYIRSGLHSIKHILIPLRLKLTGISYETSLANYGLINGMAFPVIMFGSVFIYSFSTLLIPEFSRYSVNKNKKEMSKDINKLFKVTLSYSIGIAGLLIFYGNDLGNIIYSNTNAGYYIKLLAPLIPLIYLDNVVDNILKGLGKQINVMICNIFDMVISIAFIYFLLPKFGVIGYIIVLYISETLNYVISVNTLFKHTEIEFKYLEWIIIPILCILFSIFASNIFAISIYGKITVTFLSYTLFLITFNSKSNCIYSTTML